jgi:hypothetical protein
VDSYVVEGKVVGSTVTANIKAFIGFTHNASISSATGEVLSGNGLVLKVYYDRNTITVSFNENGGANTVAPKAGKYEATITLPTEADVTKDNHILSGWKDAQGVIYPVGGVFTLKENVTLTAYWTEEEVVVPVSGVVIETYLLNVGATKGDIANYSLHKSVYMGNVSVGENVQIIPSTITGFEVNRLNGVESIPPFLAGIEFSIFFFISFASASNFIASLSKPRAFFSRFFICLSILSRSASINSVSIVSISPNGSIRPFT